MAKDKVFEGNDEKLSECVQLLNDIYDTVDQIRNREKVRDREFTPDEEEKLEYTTFMLDGICDSLNTVIEDIDRLSLKDIDGTIFN